MKEKEYSAEKLAFSITFPPTTVQEELEML